MKVVHVVNSMVRAGAELLLTELHHHLVRLGADSHVLSLTRSPDGPSVEEACDLGVRSLYRPTTTLRLARALSREPARGADVFHVHLFPSLLHFSIASRLASVSAPAVYTQHNVTNRRRGRWWGKILDEVGYSPYRRVVCVSEAVRSSLVEWMPSLQGKCEVIHNGIDLLRFQPGERTDRSIPVVISVGRLTARKGYATALRALALLSDLDLRYVLVGDGPQRKRLEKLARHLGVWERVRFAGRSPDVPELLGRADVFLHPSRSEGFGISVLEAMASGLPVVCTDLPALAEITGPSGDSALRCPPDPRAMAGHLRELLQNPSLRGRMGRSGRARAEGFDIQSAAQSHLVLYEHVVGNG